MDHRLHGPDRIVLGLVLLAQALFGTIRAVSSMCNAQQVLVEKRQGSLLGQCSSFCLQSAPVVAIEAVMRGVSENLRGGVCFLEGGHGFH